MITNEKRNSILGADTFEFETTIGNGAGVVIVRMTYEFDSDGIYNETIDTVRSPSGYPLMDYLEESTIDDLCLTGCTLLIQSKTEVF
jgi:hypothetical protein